MSRKARTTQRCGKSLICCVATLVVAIAVSPFSLSQKELPPKTNEDLPPGPLQAKATSACLECHEARIILQQRLGKAAWTKEVDKMIRWGAVVDSADRDALIDYLSTNFSPEQPPYQAPRTTSGRSGAKEPKLEILWQRSFSKPGCCGGSSG